MKAGKPNLTRWRDFRIQLLTEAEVTDVNNPLIMKLEELKLQDLDNLSYKAQQLINKSNDETLTSSERNIYKQKVSNLIQHLDTINSELKSLSELV